MKTKEEVKDPWCRTVLRNGERGNSPRFKLNLAARSSRKFAVEERETKKIIHNLCRK